MDRAAVLLIEEFAATVRLALRHERRYLKDSALRVHHGRARRSGEVLQRERDYVRIAQATADALNIGGY